VNLADRGVSRLGGSQSRKKKIQRRKKKRGTNGGRGSLESLQLRGGREGGGGAIYLIRFSYRCRQWGDPLSGKRGIWSTLERVIATRGVCGIFLFSGVGGGGEAKRDRRGFRALTGGPADSDLRLDSGSIRQGGECYDLENTTDRSG